jgi:hypothetical protein
MAASRLDRSLSRKQAGEEFRARRVNPVAAGERDAYLTDREDGLAGAMPRRFG